MTSEWLPRPAPPFLPPSCPLGWVSSQTGVIELAVTDSAALTRTGWRELSSGLTERHTASGYSLYFCKCRWFLVLNNVLSAGCYLQAAKIEMYCYKEVLNVLFFSSEWQLEHLMTNNHSMNRYFSQHDLWSERHFSFFLLIILSHTCCDTPDDQSTEVFLFSPREKILFTERLPLSLSLSLTP